MGVGCIALQQNSLGLLSLIKVAFESIELPGKTACGSSFLFVLFCSSSGSGLLISVGRLDDEPVDPKQELQEWFKAPWKEFMSMNADDRYEDALRKKELKNKRRRELYAKSQQEKNMQQPQSDCNSTFLVDENTVPRKRRRRAVSATKTKQVAKEIHGENIQIRQRKSMRFVGVSIPVVNCIYFYESMTCKKTMCAQPKLIPDISPGQSSWTAKVVVAEKNIARTAQQSPVKYQTMVLVDPKVVQTKNGTESHIQEVMLINERAAANKERLDEIVAQKSYLESSMFVKVCPPAKHKICKIKDIPVLLSEAYIQIKDCTGCIDATIMGEMAESFLRSKAMTLMNLTTPDKQSFIQAIRTSIDEEQILYVRATERDAEGTIVKYDVVYMFNPVTELDEPLVPSNAANNIVKSQPEHISRINKGKQIVKPVQRALFSLKDSDSSQGEEDGMPSATTIFNHSIRDRVSTIVTSSSEEDNVPPSNK
ncbi:Uncharacterized protein Fot_14771 [Forsythia ovata]|uniref:Uncharacterized protein n=1 Tax=Forsythia ovata TaxID=205694 RepID=A0ABD1W9T3_9LAMI